MIDARATARIRGEYDAYADRYDRETGWYERFMLGDGRAWACSQARGQVLEVAIGTGRNLAFYPPGTPLVGVDLSSGMLAYARTRAAALQVPVRLVHADAQALPFPPSTFDTVLCTLGLSSVPDEAAVVTEMHRVLRPGGALVLLGHVASRHRIVRSAQRAIQRVAATRATDRQTGQVASLVRTHGFTVRYLERSRAGIIERLIAHKD